ncbi:unnamed protein product [Sphagnum jensenii]|uniref:Pentatricopeptide repeat-containing protein n=1 Tax=Sphagnum jensenii TaxID=128206 RepID=A0ABP1BM14_9BRYO
MYVKCRSILDVNQVFYNMPTQDGVSWITMISGYAQQGYSEQAFYLFGLMQQEGLKQWCPPYNWKSRNNSETGHEGYVKQGYTEETFKLVYQMHADDLKTDKATLSAFSLCV